jgi:hypothetical protein
VKEIEGFLRLGECILERPEVLRPKVIVPFSPTRGTPWKTTTTKQLLLRMRLILWDPRSGYSSWLGVRRSPPQNYPISSSIRIRDHARQVASLEKQVQGGCSRQEVWQRMPDRGPQCRRHYGCLRASQNPLSVYTRFSMGQRFHVGNWSLPLSFSM